MKILCITFWFVIERSLDFLIFNNIKYFPEFPNGIINFGSLWRNPNPNIEKSPKDTGPKTQVQIKNIENQQSPLKSPQTSPPERPPLANVVKEVHQGLKKRRFWSQMLHQQGNLRTEVRGYFNIHGTLFPKTSYIAKYLMLCWYSHKTWKGFENTVKLFHYCSILSSAT